MSNRDPWMYPFEFFDDPEAQNDIRKLDRVNSNRQEVSERAVSAYWQRRADYARAWISRNPNASQEDHDRAFAQQVWCSGNAETAGGMRSKFEPIDLEQLHRETKNPLFMWAAISAALNGWKSRRASPSDPYPEPPPIPAWCVAPLRSAANALVVLGQPGCQEVTSQNVANALKLLSKGRNAYKDRSRVMERRRQVEAAAKLQDAGLTPQRARRVVFPNISDDRALRRAAKKATPRVKPPREE